MKTCSACAVLTLFVFLGGFPSVAVGQDARPAAMYVAPPLGPPATAAQMRAKLEGMSLPAGFRHKPSPPNSTGEVSGVITGPEKLEVRYRVAPTGKHELAQGQVYFTSEAMKLKTGEHRWAREQYVGDELVQLTMAMDNTLVASYPDRGINMSAQVNGPGQMADALLLTLSIPNRTRRLSPDELQKLIESGKVRSVMVLSFSPAIVNLTDDTTAEIFQLRDNELVKFIRSIDKEGKIGIAMD